MSEKGLESRHKRKHYKAKFLKIRKIIKKAVYKRQKFEWSTDTVRSRFVYYDMKIEVTVISA